MSYKALFHEVACLTKLPPAQRWAPPGGVARPIKECHCRTVILPGRQLSVGVSLNYRQYCCCHRCYWLGHSPARAPHLGASTAQGVVKTKGNNKRSREQEEREPLTLTKQRSDQLSCHQYSSHVALVHHCSIIPEGCRASLTTAAAAAACWCCCCRCCRLISGFAQRFIEQGPVEPEAAEEPAGAEGADDDDGPTAAAAAGAAYGAAGGSGRRQGATSQPRPTSDECLNTSGCDVPTNKKLSLLQAYL